MLIISSYMDYSAFHNSFNESFQHMCNICNILQQYVLGFVM